MDISNNDKNFENMNETDVETQTSFDHTKAPNEDDLNGYEKDYNEKEFWEKIKKYAKKIGGELVFKALQLYYVLQNQKVPMVDKAIIIGALGYLICPIDMVPDIAPMIGFLDDAVAIALAIAKVNQYIDEEINQKAKVKYEEFFGEGSFTRTIEEK